MSRTVERLIEQHTESIAERLRTLQRLVTAFGQELRQSSTSERAKVPVRPVIVYAPKMTTQTSGDETITAFKTLRTADSRRSTADAYLQLEYRDEDNTNESIKTYGALGVPRRLIQQAQRINRAKDELREAIAPVANRRVRIAGKNAAGKQVVLHRELTTVILRSIQSSSINLLAAYRAIPLIDEPVDEIAFMLTRTRSVPRHTVQWLRDKLDTDNDLAREDLARLAKLPAKEYLVCPKPYYQRMRAHVFFQRTVPSKKNPDKRERARCIVSADLPILFPMTATSTEPLIVAPSPPHDGRRHPPSRIETTPIVETLKYFRLKEEYRAFQK